MTEFAPRSPSKLPDNLPVPVDDGQAAHLPGLTVPDIALLSTNNDWVRLSRIKGRSVVFVYVRTRVPGQTALYDYWDSIPGAAGCTLESCGFRDHYLKFVAIDVCIFGISSESASVQKQAAQRLNLPFPLLTDLDFELDMAMKLPMFDLNEHTLLKRLTMVLKDGVVEHVFYPVFPPDTHAEEVLAWLKGKAGT